MAWMSPFILDLLFEQFMSTLQSGNVGNIGHAQLLLIGPIIMPYAGKIMPACRLAMTLGGDKCCKVAPQVNEV